MDRNVRREVQDFAALGPLPDVNADESIIAGYEQALHRITSPVTDDEAKLLLQSFGEDDCYGLAWTLLHLIESAPGGAPVVSPPPVDGNEWIRRLWDRAHR